MTQNKSSTVTLKYAVDQSSIQTATLANTQVLQSIQAVGVGAQSVAEQLAAMGVAEATLGGDAFTTGLVEPLAAADTQIKAVIHDIDELATKQTQLAALPEPSLASFGVDESGGGGGSPGNLRSGLRAGGMLLGAQAGGQDLRAASQIVTLTTNFGLAGAAAGILALGVREVTDVIQKNDEAEKHRVDVLEQVAQAIASGTTGEVQAKIDQAQADIKVRQIEVALIEQQTGKNAAYLDSLSQMNLLTDYVTKGQYALGQEIGDQILGYGAAATKVHAANQAITDDNFAIQTYSTLIKSATVVTNDLTSSESGLSAVRKANADLNDQLVKYQVDQANAAAQAQQLTQPQRADKIRQDLEEQIVIQQQLASGNLLQGAHNKLIEQYNALKDEIGILAPLTNTYADQLAAEEAAKQAITDSNKNYLDTLADQSKAEDALAKTEAEIAQIRIDATAKAAQLQKDYFAKDDQTTADAIEKSLQINQDAADKRAQLEQDSADKRAKIISDANATISNAIYGRNALAAYLAEQKKQKDLADEQKAYEKSSAQLDKATQKAQKQNDDAEQKAYRAHGDAYQRELANLQLSLNKELAAKTLVLNQEQVALINLSNAAAAFAQSTAGAASTITAAAGAINSFNSRSLAQEDQAAALSLERARQTQQQQIAALPPITGTAAYHDPNAGAQRGNLFIPQYASGVSSVPYNQYAYLHAGERVLTASQNRMFSSQGGGGLSITIPIHGTQMSKRDIMDYAAEELNSTLTKAGWE